AFDAGVGDDIGHEVRLPLGLSLREAAALVNAQLLVTGTRFGCWTAPFGKAQDAQDANLFLKRERDDAADADVFARLLDALAVDADVPGFDHRLREGAALHQADAVEIAVDPHLRLSFSSSAKACAGAARRSSGGGRRPRQRQASPAFAKPTSAISRAI